MKEDAKTTLQKKKEIKKGMKEERKKVTKPQLIQKKWTMQDLHLHTKGQMLCIFKTNPVNFIKSQ